MEKTVAEAVDGEDLVAVAFSGGLDSSILVALAKRSTKVVACTAYSTGSRDSDWARKAADVLGVRFVGTEMAPVDVARELARLDLPFEPTLMDRGLWCLYSFVSESACSSGARVTLLGQLADELFGGYAKYAETFAAKGPVEAERMMNEDAREYSLRGRVRDVAACARWTEARFPFEAKEVIEFSAKTPISFKIRDGVRKAVLREAAARLGVPEGLARAPKKAAQYSSGVQRLVAGSRF